MHYIVTTRHGHCDAAPTLGQAERIAKAHMDGYLNGTHCSNDPMPKIQRVECQILHAYYFDKDANKYIDDISD